MCSVFKPVRIYVVWLFKRWGKSRVSTSFLLLELNLLFYVNLRPGVFSLG